MKDPKTEIGTPTVNMAGAVGVRLCDRINADCLTVTVVTDFVHVGDEPYSAEVTHEVPYIDDKTREVKTKTVTEAVMQSDEVVDRDMSTQEQVELTPDELDNLPDEYIVVVQWGRRL